MKAIVLSGDEIEMICSTVDALEKDGARVSRLMIDSGTAEDREYLVVNFQSTGPGPDEIYSTTRRMLRK